MPSTTGGCLCGGVRFELAEPATAAGYCHCTRCQKRTGTSQSAQARVEARTFRLLAGEDLVKGWRHPDGGYEKCFCRECGSHLFSRSPDGTQMSVRLSAFDGDKAEAAQTLAAVLPLCRPGTLLVADNVVRGGAVADPEDPDPRVRGVRALADAVAADPRLVATALQTVGEKGHDGLLLALVV